MEIDTRPTFNVAADLLTEAARLTAKDPWKIPRKGRERAMYRERFAVIWTLRQFTRPGRGGSFTDYSYPRLARLLGFDDHSSVWYGYRRAEELREIDPQFRNLTNELLAFAMRVQPRTKIAA